MTSAAMAKKLRLVLNDLKAKRDVTLNRRVFRHEAFEAKIPLKVLAKDFALQLDITPAEAQELLMWKVTELKGRAAAIRPQGFKPLESKWNEKWAMINPLLPDESRPAFSLDEAYALNAYSDANYDAINTFIRDGKPALVPPNDKHYAELKTAFAKAAPFAEPLKVVRGMNFKDPARLTAFLKKCYQAYKNKELFPLLNFVSTGTTDVPKIFEGNVLMSIVAKAGIDLQPYTKTPKERELLLNEGTMVFIHSIEQEGGVYRLRCEQILPNFMPGAPSR